jgi:capsular exopolysaccharide synthesis family protein
MSRIHQALKRAETERTLQSDVAGGAIQDVHVEEMPAIPPLGAIGAFPTPEGRTREFLRFDDLWNHCSAPGWKCDHNLNVFANPAFGPGVKEQFRTLRSRLYQLRDKQPLHTVLVTSSLPAEGKTFLASNMAQSLARQQGCKVLLVDADLRRPGLHHVFGAPCSPGLAGYLKGEADETAVVQRGLPEYLCLIPAGGNAENPAELLANGRLKVLLQTIGPIFDWIILDSPPLLPVSDALLLADLADGVLTVVRSGRTAFDSARRTCQQLRDKNLLGVALNCAAESDNYGSYYYEGRNGEA